MFVISISKATSRITSVLSCNLPTYLSKYKNLLDGSVYYKWVDSSAFSSSDVVGDFLAHPYNYTFIEGRDYSDNVLAKKTVADAKKISVDVPAGKGDVTVNIPDGYNYLGINTLIAAGGRGSSTSRGGCGAALKNVVLTDLSTIKTLTFTLEAAGNENHPNGGAVVICADGKVIYKLQGGLGSTDNDTAVTADDGDGFAIGEGSGGYWELTIGGAIFDGNSKSTSSLIPGYGGGGDYNKDGSPGLIDVYFSDQVPPIDGPIVSVNTVPKKNIYATELDGTTITLPAGDNTISVSEDKPYLCLIEASSGGGYGDTVIGGQGASSTTTWWRLYPFYEITFSVGKGGSVDSPDGGDTTITYKYNDITNTLLLLSGGKSTGIGGVYKVCSGTNNFDGKNNTSTPPLALSSNNGYGGNIGANGGDGIISYAFYPSPPIGVKVYDALEEAVYDKPL